LRIALLAALFGAVAVATWIAAYPRMFAGFASYDDEGYLLISLRQFLAHGSLYDDVFSQYGPFYYEAWGGLFSLFGITVAHDAGRFATLAAWVFSSLALGVSAYRITRSAWLGVIVQIAAFAGLSVMTQEPMHPGGLIAVLLAAIVLVSTGIGSRAAPRIAALLGAAVAALILVKINVGAFALISLALTCSVLYAPIARRSWLRLGVGALFVAVPILLMAGKLDQESVLHYCGHVFAAALALVVVLLARRDEAWRPSVELRWLVGGLLGAGLLICIVIVTLGTSPGGLYEGVIGQPLRQPNAFAIALQLPDGVLLLDAVALIGALAYVAAERLRPALAEAGWWRIAVSVVCLLVGLELILATIGWAMPFDEGASRFGGFPLSMLAFAWVALVRPPGAPADRATAFPALFLPALAVLQGLHAYPVAGSQVGWASFLLVPVGAICVINGARGLGHARSPARPLAVAGVLAGLVLLLFLANQTLRRPYDDAKVLLDGWAPLELEGSGRMRLFPAEAQTYRDVAAALNRDCAQFEMLPGMNSFYLWSGREPPTGFNATGWMTLFSDELQSKVVRRLEPLRGLCLLRNRTIEAQWTGSAPSEGPLVDFLEHGFAPLASFGDYELLRRESEGGKEKP
jgi:hypothetical protein